MSLMSVNDLTYEAMFNSASNAMLAVDARGLITFFNPAAARLTRVPVETAVGRPVVEVIPNTGLPEVLRTGRSTSGQKLIMDFPDGRRIFLANRSPVLDAGRIVGAVGIFQEISELEAIACELQSYQELTEELDAIIDTLSDGVFITDGRGVVLRVNQAYEKITGLGKDEVVGKEMKDLVAAGIFSHSVTMEAIVKKQAVTNMRLSRTGNTLIVTAMPVFNRLGKVFRVVVTVRDITELNHLRWELEESRSMMRQYRTELSLLTSRYPVKDLVAQSKEMLQVLELAMRVAQFDSSVIILGESGVGKDVLARLIHQASPRKGRPFIQINCGAIPENLLESELFGYESGAFTGASKTGKIGLFEAADGGTLLLDEVGELPLELQVKLLRVLQTREVTRLGSTAVRRVDLRIIAATNRNLERLVKEGRFREDLYFRLNVVPITVPPLRRRREDIVPLIYHFQQQYQERYNLKKEFAPEVMEWFLDYSWPGNVRELENMVERLLVTSSGAVIGLKDLPHGGEEMASPLVVNRLLPWREAVHELERQLLHLAFKNGGSITRAAHLLGVDVSTVSRKWRRLQKRPGAPGE